MYKHLTGALLSAALLFGSPLVTAETVATVNGEDITEDMLLMFQQQLSRGGHDQVNRDAALEQLVNVVIVSQEAEKQGIDKRPDVMRNLAWQRRGTLAQLGISDHMQKNPVKDDEVKAMYDEFLKSQSGQEYKARHILVESEDEAKAIIKSLGNGGDFGELAKEKSKDPGSSVNGGDLGWFSPDRMVKPFSEAVVSMKKGTYTKTPVQTQFGWHVIQLEDQRALQPPTLEQIKPQLQQRLTQERMQAYIQKLRDKAKVDIKQ